MGTGTRFLAIQNCQLFLLTTLETLVFEPIPFIISQISAFVKFRRIVYDDGALLLAFFRKNQLLWFS